MKRGDIVLIDFPYTSGAGSKKRPALVVQCDKNNARLHDTIVAIITSSLTSSHEPTQYVLDSSHPDWVASGLKMASVVKCEHLYTFHQSRVLHTIGHLSATTMFAIDECLKSSLEIS